MDERFNAVIQKAKAAAQLAGAAAEKGFDSAAKATGELTQAAKLKKQQLELESKKSSLLKELGAMVYATHCGEEISPEELDEKLSEIDEINQRYEAVSAEAEAARPGKKCPVCGAACGKNDVFCKLCGAQL